MLVRSSQLRRGRRRHHQACRRPPARRHDVRRQRRREAVRQVRRRRRPHHARRHAVGADPGVPGRRRRRHGVQRGVPRRRVRHAKVRHRGEVGGRRQGLLGRRPEALRGPQARAHDGRRGRRSGGLGRRRGHAGLGGLGRLRSRAALGEVRHPRLVSAADLQPCHFARGAVRVEAVTAGARLVGGHVHGGPGAGHWPELHGVGHGQDQWRPDHQHSAGLFAHRQGGRGQGRQPRCVLAGIQRQELRDPRLLLVGESVGRAADEARHLHRAGEGDGGKAAGPRVGDNGTGGALLGEKTHQLRLLEVGRQAGEDELVAEGVAAQLQVRPLRRLLAPARPREVQGEAAQDGAVGAGGLGEEDEAGLRRAGAGAALAARGVRRGLVGHAEGDLVAHSQADLTAGVAVHGDLRPAVRLRGLLARDAARLAPLALGARLPRRADHDAGELPELLHARGLREALDAELHAEAHEVLLREARGQGRLLLVLVLLCIRILLAVLLLPLLLLFFLLFLFLLLFVLLAAARQQRELRGQGRLVPVCRGCLERRGSGLNLRHVNIAAEERGGLGAGQEAETAAVIVRLHHS
mmetsp:Transcript_154467/g.375037  ORF Transcript_154467/g.375037 Transcript_154467/m.375037 type:complete len:579 (+) Transcript_154467:1016-2752(+)